MIAGISAQLPERWKLKIGKKGPKRTSKKGREYRLPEKADHITICLNERDENGDFIVDEEMTKTLGGGSLEPKVVGPITLLYNDPDLNLWTKYRLYEGETCSCKGNGETALRLNNAGEWEEIECRAMEPMMCPHLKERTCKANGILSFIFPTASLSGVCKFRTTGRNSIACLMGGMAMIGQLTGGRIAGIPLQLRLNDKPTEIDGKKQTVYFLSLEYDGNAEELRQKLLETTQETATHLAQMNQLEAAARKRLTLQSPMPDTDDEDAEEFYPTAEEKDNGAVVDKQSGELIQAPEAEQRTPKFPTAKKETKTLKQKQLLGEGEEEGLI